MQDEIGFIDTNILVYVFDTTDVDKHEIAVGLMSKACMCISVQVINEFINVVTRKVEIPVSFDNIQDVLHEINNFTSMSSLTYSVSQRALQLKLKYQYSFWDSMIIASALENHCEILYSEDMQHEQLIEGKLKIVNPFFEIKI